MKKLLITSMLSFYFVSIGYANPSTQPKIEYNKNVASSIDMLAQKIQDYKNQNPNATDEELNAYTEKLLQTEVSSKPIYEERGVVDYVIGIGAYATGRLNAEEKALFSSNKAKAVLCISHGKTAFDKSQSKYQNNVLRNGNGDAFRHAYWTALMSKDKNIGADFAKKWSDAHEKGSSGQPKIEYDMDIYNNSIGIQLGKQNATKTSSQLESIVQQSVRQGKMKIIRSNRLVSSNSSGEK